MLSPFPDPSNAHFRCSSNRDPRLRLGARGRRPLCDPSTEEDCLQGVPSVREGRSKSRDQTLSPWNRERSEPSVDLALVAAALPLHAAPLLNKSEAPKRLRENQDRANSTLPSGAKAPMLERLSPSQ